MSARRAAWSARAASIFSAQPGIVLAASDMPLSAMISKLETGLDSDAVSTGVDGVRAYAKAMSASPNRRVSSGPKIGATTLRLSIEWRVRECVRHDRKRHRWNTRESTDSSVCGDNL